LKLNSILFQFQGTNVNEAKELIRKSKLRILAKDDLDDAAMLSVHLSQIVHLAREAHLNVLFELDPVHHH